LDLCSGIGGFALGLQSTGCFKTIGFCEIDPFCQKVLKKNFPGVPIYSDIKEFKPNDEGLRPDIITSGFPCQPFSVAGKRKSEKETLRVIQESRPSWFIGENVNGIVKLYLNTILEDLESANYSTRCFNISASSIGANHQRQRIWIVANSNTGLGIGKNEEIQARWNASDSSSSNVSNSKHKRYEKGLQPETTSNRNRQRISQSKKNWWETESKLRGEIDGISYGLDKDRSNRIKGLGNAIVPQIPYYIGQVIGKMYE
jgi:DNA (cytosine-5)-methyltransferase 1